MRLLCSWCGATYTGELLILRIWEAVRSGINTLNIVIVMMAVSYLLSRVFPVGIRYRLESWLIDSPTLRITLCCFVCLVFYVVISVLVSQRIFYTILPGFSSIQVGLHVFQLGTSPRCQKSKS